MRLRCARCGQLTHTEVDEDDVLAPGEMPTVIVPDSRDIAEPVSGKVIHKACASRDEIVEATMGDPIVDDR